MAERKQRYGIFVVAYESRAYAERLELFDGALLPLR
jgi:hypothetical protein